LFVVQTLELGGKQRLFEMAANLFQNLILFLGLQAESRLDLGQQIVDRLHSA
jgi:hypothetical protein